MSKLIFGLLLLASPALAVDLEEPKELKPVIRFWEAIFSSVSPDECAFHDSQYPNVILGIEKVGTKRSLKREIAAIKNMVYKFSEGYEPRSRNDWAMWRGVPKELRTTSYFRGVIHRIRCQRGVDLAPSFERAQEHLPMIRKVFANAGIPSDIAFLPHLESGFNSDAFSRAGARGIWQFMPAKARELGLTVRRGRDYRVNPYLSTVYAAKHFRQLYKKTKSWPLAITAYNYGENGIRRAIKKFGPDYMTIRTRHSTPIFGFAAKNYYPSFLAVRNITKKRLATL
jgi:membrane-bound lytic murein transglycosylase D